MPLYKALVAEGARWRQMFEVVMVDDGSTDQTGARLRELVDRDHRFRYVRLSRNFGQQAAISAGLIKARGDAVVILDADLQDPPRLIEAFLQKWEEGYQVVYGVRQKRKEPFFKRWAYSLFYRLANRLSQGRLPLDSGDFCLMDRQVVDVLTRQMPEQIRFVRGLRAYAGFRHIGIPYVRSPRQAGSSKYSMRKLWQLALDGLFDFSIWPLRVATSIGFVMSFCSFFIGLFFIVHRLLDFKILGYSPADVPGLASLAVGLFFLGGLLLFTLGIIGEYIGRIYFEVKKRPQYIVESVYESIESEV